MRGGGAELVSASPAVMDVEEDALKKRSIMMVR
jgi:hypothetical protein